MSLGTVKTVLTSVLADIEDAPGHLADSLLQRIAAGSGDVARHKRIVLYGNSVVVGGVGASLERTAEYEVIHVPPSLPGTSELESTAPDVVVFDVDSGHAEAVFSLLETRPELLVLGVSPEGEVVQCWSRRLCRARSIRDLTALIENAGDGPPARGSLAGT